jgi:hypothetical protein
VADSRQGAIAGRNLLARVDDIATRARLSQGVVPLSAIAEIEGPARSTGFELNRLVRSTSGMWGSVADARRQFNRIAERSSKSLLGAAESMAVTRAFLGAGGTRRYLVAFQNNAEIRDQGMVLSYATVQVTGGHLAFERAGSITELNLTRPTGTPIPPGTARVFGSILPTQFWQSVNATADFAWSGRAMAEMYRQATRNSVDGVIAIDVPGLAGLVHALGSISVSGLPEPLTGENARRLLLHDLYQHPPHDAAAVERGKQTLARATQAVIDRLAHAEIDAVEVGRELGDAAAGGHLKLWSRVPAEEQQFERVGLGGGPAIADADRTFHVAVENRTATKLDYYVRPSVRQRITVGANGSAFVRTTVIVHNRAPAGPPSEQIGPDEYTDRAGLYKAWVLLWGPAGSEQPGGVAESGLNLSQYVLPVGPGDNQQVQFDTVIPKAVRGGRLNLRFVPQPRLDSADLTVTLDAPAWSIDGQRTRRVEWDRIVQLSWGIAR